MSAACALFGDTAVRSRNLVEFKAGKMSMVGKRVFPDKRRGLVCVHRSDDSLVHFCWKDRATNVVEDDLIIFPDECEFKRVPECTTGRVYVLKFRASARRFFVWLQEPKSDKDEANANRINEVLNNPPEPETGGEADHQGVLSLMQNMTRDQLMHLVAGVHHSGELGSILDSVLQRNRPSTPESDSDGPPSPPRDPVLLSNLQGVLSDLGMLPTESDTESDGTGSVESDGNGSTESDGTGDAESEGSQGSTDRSEVSSAQSQPAVPESVKLAWLSKVRAFFAGAEPSPETGSGSDPANTSSTLDRESLVNSQSADADQRPSPIAGSNPSCAQPPKGVRRGADSSDESEQPPNKRKKTDNGGKKGDDEVEDDDDDEDL